MDTINGVQPNADWMQQFANPDANGNNVNCCCSVPATPVYPICPDDSEMDSDTMKQQMEYAIRELERIINGLDLPATIKYQILHLATHNLRVCMNLLKLIQKNASDIAVLNEQITNANTNIQKNVNDIATLSGRISANETNIANLETKHNNQQTQINENATAINELRAHKVSRCEFDKLGHVVYNHGLQINNLETQVVNNKTAVDQTISQLTVRVTSVEGTTNDAIAKVNELIAVVTPAKIEAIENGIKENAASIETLKSSYVELREKVGKIIDKVQAHENSITNVKLDINTISAKVVSNEAGVEDNRKKVAALTAEIETLKVTDNVHGADIATLKVRADKLDEAVVAAESHINKVDTGLSAEINSIMDKLAVMEPKLNDADAQLVTLTEHVAGLEAKINGVEGDNESLTAKVNELTKAVDENKTAIKTLNETCVTINQDIVNGFNNINTNVANGFNTINGGINNEIRPAINANTQAIAQHTTQIGDLQAKDVQYGQELSKTNTTVASYATRISSVEQTAATQNETIGTMQESINTMDASVKQAQSDILGHTQQINSLDGRVTALETPGD